jgi:hypothetical protein
MAKKLFIPLKLTKGNGFKTPGIAIPENLENRNQFQLKL